MEDARILFDEILALYLYEVFRKYLLLSAAIAHTSDFERRIVRALQHAEARTNRRRSGCSTSAESGDDSLQQSDLPVDDSASICLKKHK